MQDEFAIDQPCDCREKMRLQVRRLYWAEREKEKVGVLTHTIALGSFPAPKFYRLNTSTNTVTQSGFYFASATSDDFNASIAANDAGDCFVTWTSTDASAAKNAQVRLSGKRSADAIIATPGGPSAFTSPTFYHPSADNPERWGDYSAVTTDPLNSANAWLVNEKINQGGLLWGSRIVRFGF